jgi:predicted permease
LAFHLEEEAQEGEAFGLTPHHARSKARRQLGSIAIVTEDARASWGWPVLEQVVQDGRVAIRSLLRTPGLAAAVILTIAIGIGVNTTIFTIVNGVAFRPFTVPSGAPLFSVTQRIDGDARRLRRIRFDNTWMSYVEYEVYRTSIPELAAYAPNVAVTLGGESPRVLTGTFISCNYFDLLEVHLALGRGPGVSDCATPNTSAVVVLSHELWRTAFAGDRAVMGRTIMLRRRPFTVIGITPPDFVPPGPIAGTFWVPITMQTALMPSLALLNDTHASWLAVFARPPNGTGLKGLRAALAVSAAQLDQQEPGRRTALGVEPLRMLDMPGARRAAIGLGLLLLVAVTLVLLVSCANVANLIVARAAARRREIAIRLAIGASRGRLIRQLLTETVLLTSVGGIVGVVFAAWTTPWLVRTLMRTLPAGMPPLRFAVAPDLLVWTYASALTVLAALACGLLPALRASRADLTDDLKKECGEPVRRSSRGGWRSLVLAGQMAVSMVLLLAAGLVLRGLYRAETLDPGFHVADVTVVKYDLDGAGYDQVEGSTFQRELSDRASRLPRTTTAQSWATPLDGARLGNQFTLANGAKYFGNWNVVSPSYFSLLGLPILRGRGFTTADERDHAGVAVVTESTARRFWPGSDPIGQTIQHRRSPTSPDEFDQVIGVVKDAQVSSLGEVDPVLVYLPITAQEHNRLILLVRHAGSSYASIQRDLAALIQDIDAQLIVTMTPLENNLGIWRSLSRVAASTAGTLAVLSLTLAAIGVYGLVAFTVSRRTREIGIRVALGAKQANVVRLVMRQTTRSVVVGGISGLVIGAAVSRLLSSVLYGLSPYDPLAFVAVGVVLVVVAGFASYLPARRATRVDPLVALRYE